MAKLGVTADLAASTVTTAPVCRPPVHGRRRAPGEESAARSDDATSGPPPRPPRNVGGSQPRDKIDNRRQPLHDRCVILIVDHVAFALVAKPISRVMPCP